MVVAWTEGGWVGGSEWGGGGGAGRERGVVVPGCTCVGWSRGGLGGLEPWGQGDRGASALQAYTRSLSWRSLAWDDRPHCATWCLSLRATRYNLSLKDIKLRDLLTATMQQPGLYNRLKVSQLCFDGFFRLTEIRKAERLDQLKTLSLFPTTAMLEEIENKWVLGCGAVMSVMEGLP